MTLRIGQCEYESFIGLHHIVMHIGYPGIYGCLPYTPCYFICNTFTVCMIQVTAIYALPPLFMNVMNR